jgi:type VI protein secretion system component VasK
MAKKTSRASTARVHHRAMMRWLQIVLSVVLGIVLLWFGVIWTLQGLDVWRGSFMSGSSRWLTIGVILDLAAVVLLVQAGRLLSRRTRAGAGG